MAGAGAADCYGSVALYLGSGITAVRGEEELAHCHWVITEIDTTPSLQQHDEDTGDGGDAAAAGHLLPHLLSIFSIFRGGVDQ